MTLAFRIHRRNLIRQRHMRMKLREAERREREPMEECDRVAQEILP